MKIHFDTPPTTPTQADGLQVKYAAAKRSVPRWRWYLLLTMLIVPPAFLLGKYAIAFFFTFTPGVVVTELAPIKADRNGKIAAMAMRGTHVKPGEVLVRYESANPVSERSIDVLDMPEPDPAWTGDSVSLVQIDAGHERVLLDSIDVARQTLATLEARLRLVEQLRREQAVTRMELDAARTNVLHARSDLDKARMDLANHRERIRREREAQLAAWRAAERSRRIASRREELREKSQLEHRVDDTVASPLDARVVRVNSHPGDWVTAGTEIAVLQSLEEPIVHAYVLPKDSQDGTIGRSATLRFLDGGRFDALVDGVVAEAERVPADRVSPLLPSSQSIVVKLRPIEPLPERYRIHQLPLDVRFHRPWPWERWTQD